MTGGRVVDVRLAREDEVEACVRVLAALPEHFTPDTHADLRARFGDCTVAVAAEGDEVVGCALLHPQHEGAEILYAGVLPDRRRQGLGRRLVHLLLDGTDVPVVEVKTLDASSGYEPYLPTRAFWRATGFVQIDRIDPLPGWQPGNPAAILVRATRATG